jgi:hypothetical protein
VLLRQLHQGRPVDAVLAEHLQQKKTQLR